ncbi:organic cation transporter, putative [Pediculus humanus corporis]|uniref:Organic cation transporter, putative n=1 Tax=Pediculus humanus subsp. corporis TaxID=121224 RepID=E0VDA0_PEDHC|nr:organic cation transporter, putative [Pediculus humanus corporis]EEB11356.1 organic cation transporter, putative [Pediculus humanus corporis]
MMDFDQALEELGEFGRFQIYNYLLFCLPVFFSAGNSLTYVFTAGVPNYRCLIPECENETSAKYLEPWLEAAIPPNFNTAAEDDYVPSQCLKYEPKNISRFQCVKSDFKETTVLCDSWVYEDDEWTIVGEWNITCLDKQWMLSLVGTVHFIGILIGTMIFGYLADRYGRKIIFVFCIILMSTTGTAQAISPNYIFFQIFVFLNALGTSGVYPLAFILGVELVGRKKREMSGVVLNYFYAVGEAFVGVIAALSKNWVIIQLAISVPPILFVFYYWLIPESVRWLLANKKNQKACAIINKAAKINQVNLSANLLRSMENKENDDTSQNSLEEGKIWESFKQLIKSKILFFRSFLLFYIWAANALIYYGLSVNSTSLGGNKYLNFALVCLVEIPGYTVSWWAMNKLGRRWSLSSSLFLCAITCIGAAFVPQDMTALVIILFLLGKLGITSSFGIAYVYTAELYPTTLRSIGVGCCSTMARLGAIIAPFAPLLAIYNFQGLPLIVFGVVSIFASLLSLLLPETIGTMLPDTVEEAKNLRHVSKKN